MVVVLLLVIVVVKLHVKMNVKDTLHVVITVQNVLDVLDVKDVLDVLVVQIIVGEHKKEKIQLSTHPAQEVI